MGAKTPHNRYVDLLRVFAVGAVVLGHWLVISVAYQDGRLTGVDALSRLRWTQWLTLVFQVMPVFFLAGGYASATSWSAYRKPGGGWWAWVHQRVARLVWPAAVYVAVIEAAVILARPAGVEGEVLAEAAWAVAIHLWFLAVYLALLALTPALHFAHRRWGLRVPLVLVLGVVAADVGRLAGGLPLIGGANYLLVWAVFYQLGFAWQDRTLARRRFPCLLALGGAGVLAVLLARGIYPVNMVGVAGAPSAALLVYGLAQTGLLLAAEPLGNRWLDRSSRWRTVSRANSAVMTVYLWHMVPLVIAAAVLYPSGLMPQPGIGSGQWWALRPAWVASIAAVFIPLIATLQWLKSRRRTATRPAGQPPPRHRAALLLAGIACAVVGLGKLAAEGFAPANRLPLAPLAAYACSLLLITLAGRRLPPRRAALRREASGPLRG